MGKLVSLVNGANRKENIRSALECIMPDLKKALKGKRRILIKPNLVELHAGNANTDVGAVDALIEFLRDNFAGFNEMEITIAEGSAIAFYRGKTTLQTFRNCGFDALERKYGNVRLECVEDWGGSGYFEVPMRTVSGATRIHIPKRALGFDFIISVAVPKTHNYAIATFGIKNMAGLIRQDEKSLVHAMKAGNGPDARKTLFDYIPTGAISLARRILPKAMVNSLFHGSRTYADSVKLIHCNIAEFAKRLWPDLAILDAFTCMEGDGPSNGSAVEMRAAIASCDPLKADALAARLMGLEPEDIGYLHYLHRGNLGDISTEGLVGNAKLQECARKFKMHSTYEIQRRWREN